MKDKELSQLLGLIPQGSSQCQKCHTGQSPSIRPFDFMRMWKEIGHGELAQRDLVIECLFEVREK